MKPVVVSGATFSQSEVEAGVADRVADAERLVGDWYDGRIAAPELRRRLRGLGVHPDDRLNRGAVEESGLAVSVDGYGALTLRV